MRKKYWAIMIGSLLVVALAPFAFLVRSHRLVADRPCNSSIAYGYYGGARPRLRTYSDRVGMRQVLRMPSNMMLTVVGYAGASDTWVFTEQDSRSMFLCRAGHWTTIPLEGLPEELPTHPEEAALHNGRLLVPTTEGKQLVVRTYSLAGKLLSRVEMTVKDRYVKSLNSDALGVAPDGSIAASLLLEDEDAGKVLVFDRKGHIVRTIGPGHNPQFSEDGKSLAYGYGDDVIIVQLSTGKRHTIRIWPPGNRRMIDILDGPHSFRWDSRNGWLICNYYQMIEGANYPLYAADLRSSVPKWKRLPVDADPSSWTVLDSAPQ